MIYLDLSTEVHHSIMDILEELPNINQSNTNWHRGYLQILIELIMCPTSSVCTLTRVMKIIRAQTNMLLNCLIETPLLACLCIRLPYLLCSGNLEVSKSGMTEKSRRFLIPKAHNYFFQRRASYHFKA